MEKVRQVGESYELNKYKTLNRTIELDARLANERLLATKLRLNQMNAANDKLSKQLRLAQQQCREQENKLLLAETMLRQFVDANGKPHGSMANRMRGQSTTLAQKPAKSPNRLASRFGRTKTAAGGSQDEQPNDVAAPSGRRPRAGRSGQQVNGVTAPNSNNDKQDELLNGTKETNSSATQTQQSRTRTIINDLRQRLNLAVGHSRAG